jgi:hypothetical protein
MRSWFLPAHRTTIRTPGPTAGRTGLAGPCGEKTNGFSAGVGVAQVGGLGRKNGNLGDGVFGRVPMHYAGQR